MATKREEERNEKIIRGLMKLPPNRRCINCNSLGPQYVCINFWTFVCMTCSGIHREFTHRVKSVSMSKFTSQEVEALQKGGNQRAREMFLKNWDLQGKRLPNGSDVEKVREFIKNVYVDRKFAGGKSSEKPPRDMQNLQSRSEEEMRRASSYHSFSQSPPYDFQYEERQNRKQGAVLTRKPGSDRGLYERKVSSFVYSPGRFSEHAYEEQFANEGFSDYSVSSGGEPFRSGAQSPNSLKDAGLNSPTMDPSGEIHQKTDTNAEACVRDIDAVPHTQRTASGNLGSFENSSVPLKPANPGSSLGAFSVADQSVSTHHNIASVFSSFSVPSASVNSGALDLFKEPFGPPPVSSGSAVDLFQLPVKASVSSTDLFQSASINSGDLDLFKEPLGPQPVSSCSATDLFQLPVKESVSYTDLLRPATDSAAMLSFYSSQTSPSSSLSLFSAISQEPLEANIRERLCITSAPNNDGWATFDLPQHSASPSDRQDFSTAGTQSGVGNSAGAFNPLCSSSISMQWPEFQSSFPDGSLSSFSTSWHGDLHNVQVPINALSSQGIQRGGFLEASPDKLSSNADQTDKFAGPRTFQDPSVAGKETASSNGDPLPTLLSNMTAGPSFNQAILPFVAEVQQHIDHKSSNPFDIPYDSELGANNVFLDMSSLTAALPSTHFPSSFTDGIDESWFAPNTPSPCVPAAAQGGLSYMSAQAPAPQLQNVPTHSPVASLGGNPFA
ncbi:hypothetical protein Ancab_015919 [Ancistrocladus abbreviatus]